MLGIAANASRTVVVNNQTSLGDDNVIFILSSRCFLVLWLTSIMSICFLVLWLTSFVKRENGNGRPSHFSRDGYEALRKNCIILDLFSYCS